MSDTNSFLHEVQQAGRANEKVEISDLDSAIDGITHILDKDVAKKYRETEEDTWPRATMTVYCHDCRAIVPAGIGKTLRGNARTVCGDCHSKKISMGREDALRTFYHLEKREEKK